MASGPKGPTATTASPNGVSGAHAPAPGAVNRKKQKRREKQAAKQAAEQQQQQQSTAPSKNGHPPPSQGGAGHVHHSSGQPAPQYADPGLDHPDGFAPPEGEYYSDEEPYGTNGHYPAGYNGAPTAAGAGKKSKKKMKGADTPQQHAYMSGALPRHAPSHPPPPQTTVDAPRKSHSKDRIWNTSTSEERERIKEFWLSLGEDERKSLVKIEKEAVLRKMKEQQKHSCSCTVCGRKRTAIEEELEVLYDAYYEELEQYANHQQDGGPILPPSRYAQALSNMAHDRPTMTTHPPSRIRELTESEDEEEEEGEEEEYSDDDEEDYSDEEPLDLPRASAADFFNFGNSLTVQEGGILTVADDLLKNDGKKFIEMMEQLAERRMQREEEAQYQSHPSMYSKSHSSHNHNAPPEEEEFDEDEEDEEEGYDDGDYEDDDDEEDTMTEEQRMEEGRRMFQIFAARMFEQRVLTAYREKVARERQQRLLEELAEDDQKKEQKEAKKAREAQKKKEKKEKLRLAKAEEKARKDAEKAAQEAEAKAAEEKRLEEQRKKREEQRKKREAEKKAQEEERLRKEAERLKRQHEERERQQEAERKARELKAQEKKAKDEAKRKEREEREAKEKEARDKKAQEDKERREREARAKADKERIRKADQPVTATPNVAPSSKKASQPVAVALPPGLLKQSSSTGMPSPHVPPAVPKAPTPNRPRQSSQQGSHGSSPKTPQVALGTSKSMSPASQTQNNMVPKQILTKPPTSQQPAPAHHAQPTSPMPPMGPPPGMQGQIGMGIGNMPPGLNGFAHGPSHGPIMSGMMPRHPANNMSFYPPQPGPQNFRPYLPTGMHAPGGMPMGRGFPMDGPPGLPSLPGGMGGPNHMPAFGMPMPSHSRQPSASFDKPNNELSGAAPLAQPIARPAMQSTRAGSVKPHDEHKQPEDQDVDGITKTLGSSALIDPSDDMPDFQADLRRTSVQHGSLRGAPLGFGFSDASNQPRADSYAPFGGSSSAGSMWGTPPMPFPMTGAPGWGNSPTAGVFNNPFPHSGPGIQRPSEPRITWIRRLICDAYKVELTIKPGFNGYLTVSDVYRHVDALRPPQEQPVSQHEIKTACEVFGDDYNGGGQLTYKEDSSGPGQSTIKFEESIGGQPSALGEIGSPLPGHSVPVSGFGARPFASLGHGGF
ncbi:salt tolerance down-regulator-domain-containing protein [Clohesyomyces aquaticus]|uniref:Stress response protein NST1 n=1 Tax=Clohesyomyces aquaticus TaxID=1231657 RepID=A0A1Y1ZX61_9PLEO|nr:salt tolerance down-regulator-domain-containing protein [Clohesyomyces aquaticus]